MPRHLVLEPPRTLPIQGVTTHVSNPKINTNCTMDYKNKPDTHDPHPYLLRILVILFHIALVRDKFLTTSGQLSSATKITLPRYRKEVTISMGLP